MANFGTILYDGTCGGCSHYIGDRKAFFNRYGFDVAPRQAKWVEDKIGPVVEHGISEIRLLKNDGELVLGADVYREVFRRVWWLYPAYLMSIIPGLNLIFNGFSKILARNRKRLSQVCGLQAKAHVQE